MSCNPFTNIRVRSVLGKVLLSFQLRPKQSVELVDWDIVDTGVPEPNVFQAKKAYFVMMTHGLDAQPKNVSLTLQVILT